VEVYGARAKAPTLEDVYFAVEARIAAGSPPVAADAEPARVSQVSEAGPRITLGEQSNVCVSVHVDQAVWPVPHLPEADQNFSTFFSGEMARVYREQGGSHHLPGRDQIPRFASNPRGTNPRCQDAGQDIQIDISYTARPDGKPFTGTYRIARGDSIRTGTFTRDIEEEWRTGRLERPPLTEPLQIAVTDDMRDRARFFIEFLRRE